MLSICENIFNTIQCTCQPAAVNSLLKGKSLSCSCDNGATASGPVGGSCVCCENPPTCPPDNPQPVNNEIGPVCFVYLIKTQIKENIFIIIK